MPMLSSFVPLRRDKVTGKMVSKTAADVIEHYEGVAEGINRYAHWKDGVQYVGTTGKTLQKALSDMREEMQQQLLGVAGVDPVKMCVKVVDKEAFSNVFGADCFLKNFPEILTTGVPVMPKGVKDEIWWYVTDKDRKRPINDTTFFSTVELGMGITLFREGE